MRPFVEGLTELLRARLVYRTFTTGHELRELLSYQAIDRPNQRTVVYIACHGYGGRLIAGRDDNAINLAPIALSMRRGVEGVWVGACDVGASGAITKFLSESGAVWAGGYSCAVDWHPSMLIDLAVLQELLSSGSIKTRKAFVTVVGRALRAFHPRWSIGESSRGDRIELSRALRLFARDKSRGGRIAEVTDLIEHRLGWVAVDDKE
jgi:hypothetical protein